MNSYVVHHLHDDTSNCNGFADSCTKYDEYIKMAKKSNMKAIAFSNHGGIYDWVKKKQACDKAKIKYIHGVELYLCINLEDNIRGWHIGLYSKNWEGIKELNTLMSMATSKGEKEDNSDRHMYYNPRISFSELMNTSSNIIITTACLASPLWQLSDKSVLKKENGTEIYKYNIQKRDELLNWLSKNKDRCFLEVQYHNCEHQKLFNKQLYEWHKKYNIPLIAGTDTHSSTRYKAECRKVLQKAKDSFYGEEDEFDLVWKTYDELIKCFENQNVLPKEVYMKAINNTNKLADMVEDFELDRTFKYPDLYGNNANQLWKKLIEKKLKEKIDKNIIDKKNIKKYKKRIIEEFKAMSKQNMESFMMFMSELMTWCRENDIHSSPCRGSVGGSLIAYITDVIDVDPIIWNTVFSRFCNADRISLADIDQDFSPSDRKKVYQYIINRFGNKNVSYILSLSTIQDRGSIDVLAKGLDYKDLSVVKKIKNSFDEIFAEYSKIIQEEVNLEELEEATSKSPNFDDYHLYIERIRNKEKLSKVKELNNKWEQLRQSNKELFYYFDGIKGTIIAKGNHPAGMIGSPITLYDNLGIFYKKGDENFPVSFCSMKAVDFLNYVKFDILGLKTIGIIQDTYKLINKQWKYAHEINWKDNKVWEDMNTSNVGLFQFEGDFAFDLLSKFKCKTINDMSLVNASLRPSGKSYRNRLIKKEINQNPSEEINNLLKDNYGYLVFQEDTIKFLTDICDFSGSLADTTRRCIGKKDVKGLQEQLPKILEGYCNHSKKTREIAEKEAKEFIQIVSDSSEYQFGYNHSTGYSMNGFYCAMLRHYYPLEFITSYLNWAETEEDIRQGIKLAKTKGIKLNDYKFRYSKAEYMYDKSTNSIYKGVGSIKFLNEQASNELYDLRNNKYNSFIDLLKDLNIKTSINSRQLEILIKLDYFSEFGKSKKLLKIMNIMDVLYDKKQIKKDKIIELGLTEDLIKKYSNKETAKLFKDIDMEGMIQELVTNIPNKDISIKDKLSAEIEYLGYPTTTISKASNGFYFVLELQIFKNKRSITYYPKVYNIKNGEIKKMKIKDYILFSENPFKEGNIIKVLEDHKESKRKKDENGKWHQSKTEFNEVVDLWEVY
ncbi:PHP domain-containing protein [Clostridium rectalis]|uniref:PHP domain-containing protein n=1 Tax=Clostridium rectalis TaxID=2040295 RepID=UPI000F637C4A|nr:PHP domain-containing protein [Clostridium rectalis]